MSISGLSTEFKSGTDRLDRIESDLEKNGIRLDEVCTERDGCLENARLAELGTQTVRKTREAAEKSLEWIESIIPSISAGVEDLRSRHQRLIVLEASYREESERAARDAVSLESEIESETAEVQERLDNWPRHWLLGFRDVTNTTNERTAIFSLLPRAGVGNNAPFMLLDPTSSLLAASLLANFDAFALDYVTRQKIAGTHMNFFFVNQLPVLPPSAYTAENLLFIVPRVMELVYTVWDIKPFADDVWRDADFTLRSTIRAQWEANKETTGGHSWNLPNWIDAYPEINLPSPAVGEGQGEGPSIPLPPFKWDEDRRAVLRAELDAYYAKLYGLTEEELRYILDPKDVHGEDFPSETFRVLKEKETRLYGEYRTKRLVLEAWARQRNR